MNITRDIYLNKLIRKQNNGLIKIVTGIRRCGKSYLLFNLFHNYLLDKGVAPDHIIEIALDDRRNIDLRNPDEILRYIDNKIIDRQMYYELRVRGYSVDVGIVEHVETGEGGKKKKKQLEIDFVASKGSEKYYIQSAFAMNNPEKIAQERRSLISVPDYFKKMIIVSDNIKIRRDEAGIVTMGLRNFLLDENSLLG